MGTRSGYSPGWSFASCKNTCLADDSHGLDGKGLILTHVSASSAVGGGGPSGIGGAAIRRRLENLSLRPLHTDRNSYIVSDPRSRLVYGHGSNSERRRNC